MAHTPRKEGSEAFWSIDELAQIANDALAGKTSDAIPAKTADSRLAATMTPRNLRRMVAMGAVEAPERHGRDAYFGPKHLEQVLAARELMSQGFNTSSIQALRTAGGAKTPKPPAPIAFADPAWLGSGTPSGLAGAAAHFASSNFLSHASAFATSADVDPRPFDRGDPLGLSDSIGDAGPSQGKSEPSKSTAGALEYLSGLSTSAAQRETLDPRALGASTQRFGSISGSPLAFAAGPSTSSVVQGSPGQGSTLLSGGIGLDGAYESLGRGKRAIPSPTIRSSLESEPFPGLRLTVQASPGMGELTPAQKASALEAIEQLWAAARSGCAHPTPSTPASTRKDKP